MTKTALILGASGKIGTHSAQAFETAGWSVRRFRRGHDCLRESAGGAQVIVNGFNPPGYKDWAREIPRYTEEIIEAAKASGATVIVPANVYVYGDHPGTWDASTPHRATTCKGKLRMDMEASYRRAAEHGVQSILLRAGDFIDPNRNGTLMSMLALRSIAKARITTMGDPSVNRSYTYVPDWARAAVALAEMRDDLSPFEDIPFPGTTFRMDDLAQCLSNATGREHRIERFPWWFMYLVSPFWTTAREMLEMRYLFAIEHELSGTRLRELLPDFVHTSRRQVMLCEVPEQFCAPKTSLSEARSTKSV